jgi:hypothetical protein
MHPYLRHSLAKNQIFIEQLKNAHNLRIHFDTVGWMVFSIFCAANAVLLGALFQSSNCDFVYIKWFIITCFGLGLSGIWMAIEYRVMQFLYYYENLVKDLENYLNIPKNYRTSFDNPKRIEGYKVKPMMYLVPFCGMICWFFGLSFSLLFIR